MNWRVLKMNKKSTGVAFLLWLFLGGLGAHFIYAKDKWHYLAWFWLASALTIGLLPLITAFMIPGMVREANDAIEKEQEMKDLERMAMMKEVLK